MTEDGIAVVPVLGPLLTRGNWLTELALGSRAWSHRRERGGWAFERCPDPDRWSFNREHLRTFPNPELVPWLRRAAQKVDSGTPPG